MLSFSCHLCLPVLIWINLEFCLLFNSTIFFFGAIPARVPLSILMLRWLCAFTRMQRVFVRNARGNHSRENRLTRKGRTLFGFVCFSFYYLIWLHSLFLLLLLGSFAFHRRNYFYRLLFLPCQRRFQRWFVLLLPQSQRLLNRKIEYLCRLWKSMALAKLIWMWK